MSLNHLDPKAETTFLDPRRWLVLGILMIAQFMYIADVTVVYIALPAIQSGLKADFATVESVVASYSLAYAVALITGGRLGDIFGRKRIFLCGLVGFILASAMCSLALSPDILVVSRVFQGLMAALMMPQVLSIIQVNFPATERGTAFGIFSAVAGFALAASLPLGSLLIQSNVFGLGWRTVFLINVPLGLAALLSASIIRESRSLVRLKLDWIGVALVSIGLFCLVYPLIAGREAGWPAWAFFCLIFAVGVLIVFILYERHRSRQNAMPLVELSLLGHRNFAIGLLSTFTMYAGFPSFYLMMTIYLQSGLGFTQLKAGLAFTGMAMTSIIASIASMKLERRFGSRLISIGSLLLGVSMLLMSAIVNHIDASPTFEGIVVALSVFGLGQGLAVPTLLNTTLMGGIQKKDIGSASGILTSVQQVSCAFGVAIIGIVFFGIIGGVSSKPSLQTYNYALSTSLLGNFTFFGLTFILSLLLPHHGQESPE